MEKKEILDISCGSLSIHWLADCNYSQKKELVPILASTSCHSEAFEVTSFSIFKSKI
jgi:hypothetical protein